ncbi:hypothetical protein [Hyphomicrobium sp.]|uniref:hypothetical protein n=1 Tax=Hyphomicrobium sp. TaxID=82 RepID=UPI000F928FD5|nr:hypothetical protein [Hyphomicrobium sp.]MBN9246778.1 hypothetical protein [Hyphomicrobium sp.]RUP08166.1 MAG: hypothetical protein EKK38_16645 [Hyphomicrobium sp.]
MSLNSVHKIGLAIALSLFMAGCGGFDGVQLNGKVFDAMGLNGDGAPKGDPKMAVRQPLVVPPGLEALPPPGSGKAEQPTLAEIQDPDKKLKVSQAELQRQQDAYCKTNYEEPKARGDDSADSAAGPLGPCKPSIFNAVKNWTTGSTDNGDDDSQSQ